MGTARAIARAYSAFAEGGRELGITPATFENLKAAPEVARPMDEVLGMPSWLSLGFSSLGPSSPLAPASAPSGRRAPAAHSAFADPDARLGYAYVMNKMDFHMFDDPREKALRDAVHRSIERLAGAARPRGFSGVGAHVAA